MEVFFYVHPKVAKEVSQPVGTVKSLIIEVDSVLLVKRTIQIKQARATFGICKNVGRATEMWSCRDPKHLTTHWVAEAKLSSLNKEAYSEDQANTAISFLKTVLSFPPSLLKDALLGFKKAGPTYQSSTFHCCPMMLKRMTWRKPIKEDKRESFRWENIQLILITRWSETWEDSPLSDSIITTWDASGMS